MAIGVYIVVPLVFNTFLKSSNYLHERSIVDSFMADLDYDRKGLMICVKNHYVRSL